MSVFLAVALIFCMVIPSYAVVAEGILIYKGITISAAAIKTLLVWSGVTIGAVAVGGTIVDNADKIAYTASSIWEDIKQSATTAAETVKDWVTSWTTTSAEADTLEYTTPITKSWTATEIQAVVDAFREYLSLSTTTSATGEKILNIKTLEATYTVTASKAYVQGDTVFTVSEGNTFVAFPIQNQSVIVDFTTEAVADEAITNFITAMTGKGVQVVKVPVEGNVSGTRYLDTLKIRSSEPIIYDVLTTPTATTSGYSVSVFDSVWNTTDGKKIVNGIPLLLQTLDRYPTVTMKSGAEKGEETLSIPWQEGLRFSGSTAFEQDSVYVAVVPYISYSRNTTGTIGDYRITSDGYASLMVLMISKALSNGKYRIRWTPFSLGGRANWNQTITDGYVRTADASVPIDCDITIMTEMGTLVNADEVQKEVPIVGIDEGVTVPADVLTGDVSITLPTTSEVTLEDTLVNDQTTIGTLTEAGIKTDSVAISTSTTADPSVPGGDGSGGVEFPTGAFDNIWKYVVHLVEKGADFIGFLGDCLSCIPQEISWCFYGGLVLLLFGAVISKMLL